MVDQPQDAQRDGGPADRPRDPRVEAGIDHLQTAAMELIGAARAFLDVMEDVVTDREKMADLASTVGSVAEAAARGVKRAGFEPFAASGSHRGDEEDQPGPPGRVQHIRVS